MHIVEDGLCVSLSLICLFLSLVAIVRRRGSSFLWQCQFTALIFTFSGWWGITMDEQYSFRAGVHCSSVAPVQLWSRPKAAQKCCHHTSGERQREGMWGKEGADLVEFHRVICCFYEVVLSYISVMCLFRLAVLSLVQRLIAEDMNGQEFHFALE